MGKGILEYKMALTLSFEGTQLVSLGAWSALCSSWDKEGVCPQGDHALIGRQT